MDIPLHEGFPVAAMSRLRIREAATHARLVLKLPEGRINIPRMLDGLTAYGIYYDVFDKESAPVPREVEACWVTEARVMFSASIRALRTAFPNSVIAMRSLLH